MMRYLLNSRFSWADLMGIWISVQIWYASGLLAGFLSILLLTLIVNILEDVYGDKR